MSNIKFLSKDNLYLQTNLGYSNGDKLNAAEQLRKVSARSKSNEHEFSLPASFNPHNSGITISRPSRPQKFKFTEFMLPGDALLQKTNSPRKI